MTTLKNLLLIVSSFLIGFFVVYFYLGDKPAFTVPVDLNKIFYGSKFSLIDPPSESLKGKILEMSGSILHQGRISEKTSRVEGLDFVVQGETIETGQDGHIKILFEGLELSILPNSKVEVVQTLRNNLVFSLVSGESIFDKTAELPISVRSNGLLVEVLGKVTVRSITDEGIVEVEGLSKLAFNNRNQVVEVVDLVAGQKYKFSADSLEGDLE